MSTTFHNWGFPVSIAVEIVLHSKFEGFFGSVYCNFKIIDDPGKKGSNSD